MSRKSMVKAFNEWMRRFTEEPERFDREWQTVHKFLQEQQEGKVPSYGETCAVYFEELLAEQKLGSSLLPPPKKFLG